MNKSIEQMSVNEIEEMYGPIEENKGYLEKDPIVAFLRKDLDEYERKYERLQEEGMRVVGYLRGTADRFERMILGEKTE